MPKSVCECGHPASFHTKYGRCFEGVWPKYCKCTEYRPLMKVKPLCPLVRGEKERKECTSGTWCSRNETCYENQQAGKLGQEIREPILEGEGW